MSDAGHTAAARADPPANWPADVTRDRLIGEVFLYQRRGGHRTGTDDVLTAYYAAHRVVARLGEAAPYLDLGCGVGSVLLMTAHRLRPRECVGVEAQAESHTLASRTLRELPEGFPPVRLVHQDFRDLQLGPRFALITGSPPYFPTRAGVLPADPQRLACRFELRGGVEEYCQTAARHLAPGGRFYLVHQTAADARVRRAAVDAGLALHAVLQARMREDRTLPFLSVYELALSPADRAPARDELVIRGRDGDFTEGYRRARRELGVEVTL